jgi:hypothetical protein
MRQKAKEVRQKNKLKPIVMLAVHDTQQWRFLKNIMFLANPILLLIIVTIGTLYYYACLRFVRYIRRISYYIKSNISTQSYWVASENLFLLLESKKIEKAGVWLPRHCRNP